MKKTLLTLLILAAAAAVMTATGQQEADDATPPGYRPELREDRMAEREAAREEWLEEQEIISVEGTLELVNGKPPVVVDGETRYTLMVPWPGVADLDIESGMEISVEGFEVPGQRYNWDNDEKTLHVTRAVIDGEEFTVDPGNIREGMMGGMIGKNGKAGPGGIRGTTPAGRSRR